MKGESERGDSVRFGAEILSARPGFSAHRGLRVLRAYGRARAENPSDFSTKNPLDFR